MASSLNKFDVLSVIGEGAYGIVLKCKNNQTGELVAIKKFKESDEDELVRMTTLKEVKMLRMLRQDNIVELKEAFRRKGKLYLVFEYVEKTLLEVLEARRGGLGPEEVRQYIYQLVQAVNWIHSHNAVHRDIKPENLLISPGTAGSKVGQLKLCDFGFARQLPASPADVSITDYVSTRWYRSPELLLGSSHYGKEVDIWAIGCIMAELSTGQPLFPGDSDIDQLYIVQKMLGPLCRQHDILFLKNSRFARLKFPDMANPMTLDVKFRNVLPSDALDFLKGTMTMNPSQRLSCLQCLQHPYLADLARKDVRWQQQLRHLQASVVAAARAATGNIPCDSSSSTSTHLEDSACSGPTAAGTADSRPGSLPSAVSPGSMQQQRHGGLKQPAVPRLQLQQQQPGIKAFPASNLGGSSSTCPSKNSTPRASVGHAAAHTGATGAAAAKQQQQLQQSLGGSSKQQLLPKQPVMKKQPSKGHSSLTAAAAAGQSLPVKTPTGSWASMPSLQPGPGKPGQLQLDTTTPRSRAAAASPAGAASKYPGTHSKSTSVAAMCQTYGLASPAAADAAAAAAGSGDVDMLSPEAPITSRRRKRLASGTPGGGTSLRGGGRREVVEADALPHQQQQAGGPRNSCNTVTLPPAIMSPMAAAAAAGNSRQPGTTTQQQQQQWPAQATAAHSSGYTPSKMDIDAGPSDPIRSSSSRPQSPLARTPQCAGTPGQYSLGPSVTAAPWRDAAPRDAAGASHGAQGPSSGQQQQQGLKPPAVMVGGSRWGAGGLGLVACSGGSSGGSSMSSSSQQAVSPGAGGRGSLKAAGWGSGAAADARVGSSGSSSHVGHLGSFGVPAAGLSTWPEDVAAAAVAAAAAGGSMAPSLSTRPSLVQAAGLGVYQDALTGLQASGGPAPVSMGPAAGGLYGRGSITGPPAPLTGMVGSGGAAGVGGVGRFNNNAGAPSVQLEDARASVSGAVGLSQSGGGHQQQQQQHSPPHQPYLHQHLYH